MDARDLRAIKRVKILGCGSAYYVGQMGAMLVEELARIPADAEAASEFRYRNPIVEPDTLYVAVSQSGETIDTLLAVQEIRRKGGRVHRPGQRRRQRDRPRVRRRHLPARRPRGRGRLDQGADHDVRRVRAARPPARPGPRPVDRRRQAARRRAAAAARTDSRRSSALEPDLVPVAQRLAKAESLFFVGRVRGYPVAREGAQKFKEITYRHAEAYQTSELKHGPLALIDKTVPTVAIVPDDELTDRNVGALHEIAARGGPLVVVTHAGVDLGEVEDRVLRIDVPRNERELDPILLTVPLQLLAYHAALHLGHDIDKPRNLAKSVTVE